MAESRTGLLDRLNRADVAISSRVAISAEEKLARRTPRFWLAFTGAHLGDSWVWVLITAWLWRGSSKLAPEAGVLRKGEIRAWLGTLAAVYALTLGIKQVVKRERPGTGTLMYAGGADVHSFPSGHATRMGAILAWFGVTFPSAAILGWPITLWVSWSRVAMGVHYAGDVIVGLILGFFTGEIARRLTKNHK
jgi:membrane-associated phospholipid phosphatase